MAFATTDTFFRVNACKEVFNLNCIVFASFNAFHTTDALFVVDLWHAVGRGFGDGALRAGERTGVAGETVETVGHDEGFLQTVAGGTIGLL